MLLIKRRNVIIAFLGVSLFSPNASAVSPTDTKEKKIVADEDLTIVVAPDAHPESTELQKKLELTETEIRTLRSRVLAVQDQLAQSQASVIQVQIEAVIRNDLRGKSLPLGFVELTTKLNDVELVRYFQPTATTENPTFPIYIGPMPVGTYELSINSIVGVMQHSWPFSLAQGRWNMNKIFALKLDGTAKSKSIKITFKPGDSAPTMTIDEDGGPPK
jgi:hypothetical protein